MAFWDTSAIIPLCCWQPETGKSRQLRREFQRMIVWWGTPVEARSALARLVRKGHLTPEKRLRAAARLAQLQMHLPLRRAEICMPGEIRSCKAAN